MKKQLTLSGDFLILTATIFSVIVFWACNYYKPVQASVGTPSSQAKVLDSLQEKVFILHAGERTYWLDSPRLTTDRQALTGYTKKVLPENRSYIDDKRGKYKYKPTLPYVLQELHLYTKADSSLGYYQNISLSFEDITKLELIERDKARSTVNTILAVVGVSAGVFVIAGAIAVALKSSCPFVSAYDGSEYVLQGETFGGSVYPSLARDDYLPLPAVAAGPEMKLCISNELKEKQFTDLADLVVVKQLPGQHIACTPDGTLQALKGETGVQSAWLNNEHTSMVQTVISSDNISCLFNDTTAPVNNLVLRFNNPAADKELSLVLRLRNSYWADYLYGEFISHFGSHYATWTQQQKQRPAAEILLWREQQQVPLTISVKTAAGWKEVRKIASIGPLMTREIAIPLGIATSGNPVVEVKLSAGFMFWEVDKASLALSSPVSISNIEYLKPLSATDETGRSVTTALLHKDGSYLEQPEVGNRAYLTYRFDKYEPGTSYSVFLHASGYYEPIRQFSGAADVDFLNQFKVPGALPKYSITKFREKWAESTNLAIQ